MSTRLDVLSAIAELIRAAAPDAEVVGVEDDGADSERLAAGGRIVIDAGDPGDPDMLLNPLTYLWTHRVPLMIAADATPGVSAERVIDGLLVAIGEGIVADRSLGGLADWLDAVAPETSDLIFDNAVSPRRADAVLLVTYATTNPLG